MLGLLQRVTRAGVEVDGKNVGTIAQGLVVLVGVERGDGVREAERLAERILGYRVFADEAGKMNLSLAEVGGGLLLVPQFTLPADTAKGMRPSFTPAAPPAEGERLYAHLLAFARERYSPVESGRFGAHMLVDLVNDGPVTLMLRAAPPRA